ncbi:flagellar protein FlaG [Thiomicrospira sp. WB1]|uniref:flagellar protein FlaG n=1 Tax=Thiomicrospira sp. WB1 TaxID=1685380 RepID=UPI0009E75CE3|nr:flagellar protein FlaG [Thiomicrospira sp. WB1]
MEIQPMSPSVPQAAETSAKGPSSQATVSTTVIQNRPAESAVQTKEVSIEDLTATADTLNNAMQLAGQSLAFSVDEETQSQVVKVIDTNTDEVIRQFPSDQALQQMEHINNYLNSLQQSGQTTQENLTGALFSEII